ncbi:purine and uridine phosphorylase, partial [Didymella exigua CBS 183.55]
GWVCALAVELAAAQETLDETHDTPNYKPHDTNIYASGRVGEHNVVIASFPEGQMGTDSDTEAAIQMQSTFHNTRFGLMVGIGGGVPSEEADVRLGDVVVSKPQRGHRGVVQYNLGKATSDGIHQTGSLNAPPRVLLTAATAVRAAHIRKQSRPPEHIAKLEQIPMFQQDRGGPNILFAADYSHIRCSACVSCDLSNQELRETRESGKEVAVHYGTTASGNQVIRDDHSSQELGTVLCFEIEVVVLMNRFPCLIIHGIFDYADSHKNKRW